MIYDYRCPACKAEQTIVCSVKEHVNHIPCECGEEMRQIIYPPHVITDIEPYRSVVTGERIRGRAHHRQHLRDHNLIEVGNERIERRPVELPPVGPDIKRAMEELKSR